MSSNNKTRETNNFPPQYEPKTVEERIYARWEESGVFAPEAHHPPADSPDNSSRSTNYKLQTTNYCIVVPPPNVTGSLHMGHALNATIQDILIRKKRMEGYRTLWLPGTDHAGIATQNIVEKDLKKQGLSRHDLGREKFLASVLEWKEKYGDIILNQFKKLGASMDWPRTRFTMDEKYQKSVREAFLHYYKKGWLYRAERVINWCVRCQTSLSDLELEYQEARDVLYYIKYPIIYGENDKIDKIVSNAVLPSKAIHQAKRFTKQSDSSDYIVVATVRPETMLGDSAVAVNPKDARYKNLIGKNALLPIQNREIPIIADDYVEQEFGTGAVKVTPAHDFADADMGERHKLQFRKIIGELGKMTKEAGTICDGLKIGECRERVVAELKKEELIEKEEPYRHNIAICYRCGAVIEPLPSMQWFLKMKELAEMALEAVESGKVRFHPERWAAPYGEWLKNVRDWNVSRQIWWGHRLPVWYCDKKQGDFKSQISNLKNEENNFIISVTKPRECPFCKKCEMTQETDVLDTWFSSALWPFATLGWPEKTKDLAEFYPTQVLSTDRGIINLWVSRMVFSSLEFMKEVPFSDVIIHATVLTKDGKRMSKSLGTGIDPLTLIEKYGTDATRFGLMWQAMGGQDIHWSEEHVVAGKKFCNKIWNAARFVLAQPTTRDLQRTTQPTAHTDADKKMLEKLARAKQEVSNLIDTYEFGQALHILYDFFWHEFCDIYLEAAKEQLTPKESLRDPTGQATDNLQLTTGQILSYALSESLKLLHPFMPFITEEIWSKLPDKEKNMLIVESWPK